MPGRLAFVSCASELISYCIEQQPDRPSRKQVTTPQLLIQLYFCLLVLVNT